MLLFELGGEAGRLRTAIFTACGGKRKTIKKRWISIGGLTPRVANVEDVAIVGRPAEFLHAVTYLGTATFDGFKGKPLIERSSFDLPEGGAA
jgi:hypothetical protein